MKLFISSDIEGTTGIVNWDEAQKGHSDHTYFANQMSKEVCAACQGAIKAGFDDILIKDAHSSARNIDPSLLPESVRIMRGWSGDLEIMMSGIKEGFDAVAFTGYHSGASYTGNPLAHTMNLSNQYVKINGEKISEFILNSYIAGYYKTPVCFLSGDKELCEKAKEFIPGITTVAVSEGNGNASISINPNLALKLIENSIQKALKGDLSSCMVKMPETFDVEIRFAHARDAHHGEHYPGAFKIDDQSVGFKSNDFMDVLKFFYYVL